MHAGKLVFSQLMDFLPWRRFEACVRRYGGDHKGLNLFSDSLVAVDANTGKYLWHYQTGGNHAASPISYAINGRQYVALTAGNILYSFALPE